MAIEIDGKIYRNLEEQVQFLTKQGTDLKNLLQDLNSLNLLGITVLGQVDSPELLPDPLTYEGEYGDTFLVGAEDPYDFYVFTRPYANLPQNHWQNLGYLGIVGPVGPEGPIGAAGPEGKRGSKWFIGTALPDSGMNEDDAFLFVSNNPETNGRVYQYQSGNWQFKTTIQGKQGVSIVSVAKTASQGKLDTYTIYYSNNTTSSFIIQNGQDGVSGPILEFIGKISYNSLPAATEEYYGKYYAVNNVPNETATLYYIFACYYNNGQYIWTNLGLAAGEGPVGPEGPAGVGIISIAKIGTEGLIDTYRINLTNETYYDFTVRNSENLTFDSTPTANSSNPVTSSGIYTALQSKANASDVESELNGKLNKSSANPQTIESTSTNNTTSVILKNNTSTGGYARFDNVNGSMGHLGFNENKEFIIIPEGGSSQKVITYKTMPVGGVGYIKATITSSGMTGFTVHSNNIYIRLFGTNNEYCQIFGVLWFSFTARANTPVLTLTTENLVTDDYNQVGTAIVNKYTSLSEEAQPQTSRAMYIRTYGNKIQLVMFETFSNASAGTYCAFVPLTTIRLK